MPRHAADSSREARSVARAFVLSLLAVSSTAGAADFPLHERIDALVESSSLGPIAPPAADADFLRRVYLDLNGTIPDAQTARAFLDDQAANKRAALIDRLLARPQYARHMQNVFNVMLTERRPEKGIPAADWQEFLRKSFEDNKPLDQLAREILGADGVDPTMRPAAKFYLDRDGDANLLARDIGRLFFGRDLQCAQCHDHPLVEDYLQADYYGLLAFVNRGVLFTDKAQKVFYAEKADGEVNYKSVFTGDARDHVLPKLPQAAALNEPRLTKEEQYVVAPADGVRPVPKYSRRAQLAAQATGGANAAFNRNLANRLWAQMMGRGLVHPLDVQHSNNPGVQSQLLALLADELVRTKFDVKAFLRQLALTRAYQRSSEAPNPADMKLDPGASSPLVATWNAEAQRLSGELATLQAASAKATGDLNAAYERFSKSATARDAAQNARGDAKKASDDAATALAAAIKEVGGKEETLKLLVEARDKAQAAVAKLTEDKALVDAAGQFKSRAEQVDGQLAAARKAVTERTAQMQAASLKVAEADQIAQTTAADVTTARAALDAADAAARAAVESYRTAKANHRELIARVADAQAALDYQSVAATATASQAAAQAATDQLTAIKSQTSTAAEQVVQNEQAAKAAAEKAAADRTAQDRAWGGLVNRATARFMLAPLKPLSPEQLAWATMQAVGQVDQQTRALEPQAKKDAAALANLTDDQRVQAEARLLEKAIDEKLRGHIAPFVSLFGQQPGQAPTFQATVHQALFFANGGLLSDWINPGGNNLSERLTKIEQPAPLAEELYLTVLSRRPTAQEQAQVAAYWNANSADRAAAVREMVWSLLSSAEFRFNR
ncbi:MAG: DUF1549 domain-containing protein [Planctomycetia bacterium]|nr:DUF1549 domain-containing protein [Planctomycetia bacterium]